MDLFLELCESQKNQVVVFCDFLKKEISNTTSKRVKFSFSKCPLLGKG